MTFFFMEESLPVSDEILKVADLWMIHCRIIDFRDDTVPQGEPDSAGSRVSGSHPVFISVGPSRLDARPSKSCIAGIWFHISFLKTESTTLQVASMPSSRTNSRSELSTRRRYFRFVL